MTAQVRSAKLCSPPAFQWLIASTYGALLLLAGCAGGNSANPPGTPVSQSAQVALLVSSTADDRVTSFNLTLTGITLTTATGASVPLLMRPASAEFIQLNGTAAPLLTTTVAAGTYTRATATVGAANFSCGTLLADGSLDGSTFAYGATPAAQVKVNLPSPIVVSDSNLTFTLDLQESASVQFGGCAGGATQAYSINPTFDLTAATATAIPALVNQQGVVNSVDVATGTFVEGSGEFPVQTVSTNGSTQFEGVSSLSDVTQGMPIDFDLSLQADGSLLATRVEVLDSTATNLGLATGYVGFLSNAQPTLNLITRNSQGFGSFSSPLTGIVPYSFGQAAFNVAGPPSLLLGLPFTPAFTASTMVPGQLVTITTHTQTLNPGPVYLPATTVTLVPQTLNGTVTATGTEGQFQVSTLKLASYDLSPTLAVQAGQTVSLTQPNTVTIYMPLGQTAVVSGLARVTGLLFNDQGTLRMVASSSTAGVQE